MAIGMLGSGNNLLSMNSKQRTWGQFSTPDDLADLLLGLTLRQPDERVLDPSCGEGALLRRAALWQRWLASDQRPDSEPHLYGVELDTTAASSAAHILPDAHITNANFFGLPPATYELFDAIIGNPPYTRAEWLDRLDATDDTQLSLLPDTGEGGVATAETILRKPVVPHAVWSSFSGRSGLHAYFFHHSLGFLREGGRLGFVVPNGWLDVGYGLELKQFLLDHFRIVAVIESSVERWFEEASVNTCLVILEKSSNAEARTTNRVRFARLRRPLSDLLDSERHDPERVTVVEQLIGRLLPPADRSSAGVSVRVMEQGQLEARQRWGPLLRAPAVFFRTDKKAVRPLAEWMSVRRGYTTGANSFFYLEPETVERWGIEARFRQPLLKSLRHNANLRLWKEVARQEVLAIGRDDDLSGTATADYLALGETLGINERSTCAARNPWYVLPELPAANFLLPKGVWQRHLTPLLEEELAVDQQLYQARLLASIPSLAAAALLNSSWFALQCELQGRVNLGDGVLWLANYEIGSIRMPDPRQFSDAELDRLEWAFLWIAGRPIIDTVHEIERPDRVNLDNVVFDTMGLSHAERDDVRTALVECLIGRRARARTWKQRDPA